MNIDQIKHLYLANGFFWTSHLEEFCREHAGEAIKYLHPFTKELVMANFCVPELILVGRKYGQHEMTVKYLAEEIAPIGICSDGNIELLLTSSGRLIGFADYMLLDWLIDGEPSGWKNSLKCLLDGRKPITIGIIE